MTHVRQNLELKAYCRDLAATRSMAIHLGAVAVGVLEQVDTYFKVPAGRLKLREIDASRAELIFYHRPTHPSARLSQYHLVAVADPASLAAALSAALGITTVVRKRRELLLWHNVRIHLDAVENLGGFIEFEAVLESDLDLGVAHERLQRLSEALGLATEDRVAASYGELLHIEAKPPPPSNTPC
jgi:adenylate cyclase, class 2